MESKDSSTVPEENLQADETQENELRELYTSLPYLQSSIFATILEDTSTQLRILCECNNELRIIKTYSEWDRLLKNKFNVQMPPSTDELEGIDLTQLHSDTYKINKLDYDRNYIIDAVLKTYTDLCLNGSFTPLEDIVKILLNTDNYRMALFEEEARNKMLKRELMKQIRHSRNHYKRAIYETDSKIDELKTQLEDSALIGECRSRYIDNWQRARTEQHIQKIHDKEIVYSDTVDYFKRRTDQEQRVHHEIDMLINININETLQKVEEWMTKYDKDTEALDLKIQLKKNEYGDMVAKREKMEELIEKREILMKEWVNFKDEREKARLYREKMTNSAITVQAWWRGLLVRLQLGPYKVKKKGGGKKK